MATSSHRKAAKPDTAVGTDELVVVRKAKYIRDYVVEFTFTDGSKREMDLSPFLRGPIYEPLKDLGAFRKFKIRYGSIAWPNGADIAPETLYYDLGPVPSEANSKA